MAVTAYGQGIRRRAVVYAPVRTSRRYASIQVLEASRTVRSLR